METHTAYATVHELATTRAVSAFKAAFEVAQLIGLGRNAAAISANTFALKHTGINMLVDMGLEHLLDED